MKIKYSLWIDDVRNPMRCHAWSDKELVFWAQDVEQAKFYVRRYGMPHTMFLDHDLGKDSNGAETTVMEFLRWLENLGYEPVFRYAIISQNPDGSKSIDSFIQSWRRVVFQQEEELCQ